MWSHLDVESKQQNEQRERKQNHRYREQSDGHPVWEGVRGLGENAEGIEKHKQAVTK